MPGQEMAGVAVAVAGVVGSGRRRVGSGWGFIAGDVARVMGVRVGVGVMSMRSCVRVCQVLKTMRLFMQPLARPG